jgi:DHA2 family multidrug resistance protein
MSLIAFVMRELTVAEPIVDLRILKNRNFGVGTLLMTIVGGVLYSTTALLPLFLQTLLGYPALQSGLAISPRGIGSMASMIVVGRLVGKIDSRLLMTFGFFVLATSMYLLAGVNLEIASSNIVWPSLINGFAMGFIFVPLTTVAMGTLKREQMGNAAGIYSLMRNIGGGLGISAVTTLLARGAQQHQAVMVSHLTPYDSAFQQRMQQLQDVFGSTAAGVQKAYLSLYGTLIRQATLLAFVDNFRLLTFVCLACIPLVFLLKRVGSGGGGSAALH